MKYFLFSFLISLSFSLAQAQIANEKMNIVYRGLDNPISFGVFGYSCKSVYITVDTGNLRILDEPNECGTAIYSPPATGTMATFRLFAKTKKGSKKIWESRFRIRDIPDPEACIMGKRNDTVNLAALKVQTGMIAKLPNFDICTTFKVERFDFAVIRGDNVLTSSKNYSAYFNENIKKQLGTLENNDRVLFYNIYCIGADKRLRKLESFELVISK